MNDVTSIINMLFKRVDNIALIIFRVLFGLMAFAEAFGSILTGWIRVNMIEPSFTFNFIGFDFLQPLPGNGMYFYYGTLAILGLMIMAGYYYRIATIGYLILWTGVYLMQKTSYNNHYYLMVLLLAFMAIVPAHRYYSLDVRRNPAIKSDSCPQWCLWIFIIQMAIVYFYAAINKLYPDWLEGRPISLWFNAKSAYPIFGRLYVQEWFQMAVAYGGFLFDLLVVPLFLWRRTRMLALGLSLVFHLFNSYTFRIGVFPYMSLALTVFFFSPLQLRKLFFKRKPVISSINFTGTLSQGQRIGLAVFVIYFLFQIGLPLRHWFFPGLVHWTEEGHRLSWQMMLRSKQGSIYFKVRDNQTGEEWNTYPREHLTSKQANNMATHPDMIWQYVQFLKKYYSKDGYNNISIFAVSSVSLNDHPSRPLILPEVDLARVEWKALRHNEWINAHPH